MNLLGTIAVAGITLGVLGLGDWLVKLWLYGWGYWHRTQSAYTQQVLAQCRQEHHVPHRNGFQKRREFLINGQDVRR